MEALTRQRDADHFEVLAFARQAQLHGAPAGHQQRLVAGVVDRGGRAVLVLGEGVVAVFGLIEPPQPRCDLRIVVGDFLALPRNRGRLARQFGLDRAHCHRQARAFACFDNPEARGEFDQRRRGGEADCEGIARGINERAARQVLDPGGKHDLRGGIDREAACEVQVGDLAFVLVVIVQRGRALGPVGKAQAHRQRDFLVERRGEAQMRRGNRVARGLAVDPAAFEIGGKRLPHREIEALVAAHWFARIADNGRRPDQRHIVLGRQRAAAFERQHCTQRSAPCRRIAG